MNIYSFEINLPKGFKVKKNDEYIFVRFFEMMTKENKSFFKIFTILLLIFLVVAMINVFRQGKVVSDIHDEIITTHPEVLDWKNDPNEYFRELYEYLDDKYWGIYPTYDGLLKTTEIIKTLDYEYHGGYSIDSKYWENKFWEELYPAYIDIQNTFSILFILIGIWLLSILGTVSLHFLLSNKIKLYPDMIVYKKLLSSNELYISPESFVAVSIKNGYHLTFFHHGLKKPIFSTENKDEALCFLEIMNKWIQFWSKKG